MKTKRLAKNFSFEEVRTCNSDKVGLNFEILKNVNRNFIYYGPITDLGGYAFVNRLNIKGLVDRGFNIKVETMPTIMDISQDEYAYYRELERNHFPGLAKTPKIYGITPPNKVFPGRPNIFMTMMETRNLHQKFIDNCNRADLILNPSHWGVETFQRCGITTPIKYAPIGLDFQRFQPGLPAIPSIANVCRSFTIMMLFGWSFRKGIDLIKTYLEEFTNDEDITLLICSRYAGGTGEEQKRVIRDYFQNELVAKCDNRNIPHVILFMDTIPNALMPNLYNSAHVFFSPSRGEGFNLPLLEATACGLPVIATNYSAMTDYCDRSNSFLIDVDEYYKCGKEISWISEFYVDQEFPSLQSKKVLTQTQDYLRFCYENYTKAKKKAVKLRNKIMGLYNQDDCLNRMANHLLEFTDEPKNNYWLSQRRKKKLRRLFYTRK